MEFRSGATLALLLAVAGHARADIVFYNVPKLNITVMLQGRSKVLRGRNVSFRHPKFSDSRLILALENVKIVETLTPTELFNRKFGRAVTKKDTEQIMRTATWALHHGLLEQFYQAVHKVLELDPRNAWARQIVKLKDRISKPITITEEDRDYMKKIVRLGGMRFETSAHFLLMCDTPTIPGEHRKEPRAQERLALLEMVYESFLMKFHAYATDGTTLAIPSKPLMVVLFNDEQDFRGFSIKLSPELASAAGFWNSKTNVSFFYDHGTSPEYKSIRQLSDALQQKKAEYIKDKRRYAEGEVAKFVRMANTLSLLVEISQENSDIEVVSHEITHQMAGNTGLLPRDVRIPTWTHEGLATYFEAPKEATWSGIGAVNSRRLKWYRELQSDRQHSNIDFIVTNYIFDNAKSSGATLHGYGQAWGLTHFLMNKHFDQLMRFYRRLGQMPPDILLTPDVLTQLFSEVFGKNRGALDTEWRRYMQSLKTDTEVFTKEARR